MIPASPVEVARFGEMRLGRVLLVRWAVARGQLLGAVAPRVSAALGVARAGWVEARVRVLSGTGAGLGVAVRGLVLGAVGRTG